MMLYVKIYCIFHSNEEQTKTHTKKYGRGIQNSVFWDGNKTSKPSQTIGKRQSMVSSPFQKLCSRKMKIIFYCVSTEGIAMRKNGKNCIFEMKKTRRLLFPIWAQSGSRRKFIHFIHSRIQAQSRNYVPTCWLQLNCNFMSLHTACCSVESFRFVLCSTAAAVVVARWFDTNKFWDGESKVESWGNFSVNFNEDKL
jgi:hypothetical protein